MQYHMNISYTNPRKVRHTLGKLSAPLPPKISPVSAESEWRTTVLNPILTRGVCLPMCESGLGRLVLWWAPRMRQKLRNKGQADPTWLFRYTGMIL